MYYHVRRRTRKSEQQTPLVRRRRTLEDNIKMAVGVKGQADLSRVLKMDAVCSSEMLVSAYKSTRR
jgi:hypothetical protein